MKKIFLNNFFQVRLITANGTEVFKTADIRKELLERIQKGEAEPEKLKGFYEIGKYNAEVIFGDTKKKKDKLENAYSEVINDENSKNLREMLDEATTDKERINEMIKSGNIL